MTSPRIGIDLRAGRSNWLGGLYYLRNLILAVRSLPEDQQPELIGLLPVDDPEVSADALGDIISTVAFCGGVPHASASTRVRNRIRQLFDSASNVPFGIGRAALREEIDVLFPTLARELPGGVVPLPWLYDLQHLHKPGNFSRRERVSRSRSFRQVLRSKKLLVVSSAVAAAELARRYPRAAPRLRVLRFTTVLDGDWFDGDPFCVAERYGFGRDFLLMPGQFWVHKDHRVAFESMRLLRDTGVDVCLVCTGSTNDYRRPDHMRTLEAFLSEHRLQKQVHILGVVPRSDYIQLLRAARLVIQPSAYEGWSSIVEDARALGKRVVLSNIPVHIEQAPEGGLFFRCGDAEALAERILDGLRMHPAVTTEGDARNRQQRRVSDYGRRFVAIAREAFEMQ